MNKYQIYYRISPADGGEPIATSSSFIFNNIYEARDYAKAFVKAGVEHVGHVINVAIMLNGECVEEHRR